MQVQMLVLEEGEREVTFNGQSRKLYELSLRDQCKVGVRCKTNFRYELRGAELDKFKGKLRDQTIGVNIADIGAPYNGQFPLTGSIEFAGVLAK